MLAAGEHCFANSAGYFIQVLGAGFVYNGDDPAAGSGDYTTINVYSDAGFTTLVGSLTGAAVPFDQLFTGGEAAALVGADLITGSGDNDTLTGGPGADTFVGGAGSDTIVGGGAEGDTVDYSGDPGGVLINQHGGQVQGGVAPDTVFDGYGDTDSIVDVLNLIGSAFNDTIWGGAAGNTIIAGGGNDFVFGNDGPDTISGGGGNDTLEGGDGPDSLMGGNGNDILRGENGPDTLRGGQGSDTLGGGGGDDLIDGGSGFDFVSYNEAGGPVRVELFNSRGIDFGGGIDQLISIEGVAGSQFDDRLYGNDGDNILNGRGGSDIMYGLGGIDAVGYGNATAGVRVELFNSYAIDDGGAIDFLNGFENVVGSAFADRLYGNSGDNLIRPGNGADIVYGVGGTDTISYADATAGVRVELFNRYAIDAGGATDFITGFVNAEGSDFADRLYGTNSANALDGGAGADIIYGLDGDDDISGGAGADLIIGGNGADTLSGGDDDDRFYFLGTETGGPDTIADFASGIDAIYLRAGAYGTYGVGDTADLFIGTGTSDTIFGSHTSQGFAFDTGSGGLFFDADGAGGADAAQVAILSGLTNLASTDIIFYI